MTLSNPAQYISGRTVQEQMNSLIDYVDVRAAEVATDAIASDVAQVHQDMLDADADATAAAASAAAAAGTLANAVKKTGESSQSIAGDIDVSGDLDVGGDADITGALDVTGAITGNDASLIGTVTVPTEATGTFTMKSANSTKVKNELDNYAPMLRTTGNQTLTGVKESTSSRAFVCNYNGSARAFDCKHPTDDKTVTPSGVTHYPLVAWDDMNDNIVCMLRLEHSTSDGKYRLVAYVANAGPNGSGFTQAVIATGGYS